MRNTSSASWPSGNASVGKTVRTSTGAPWADAKDMNRAIDAVLSEVMVVSHVGAPGCCPARCRASGRPGAAPVGVVHGHLPDHQRGRLVGPDVPR